MSMVHDRFQVCCGEGNGCGLLSTFQNKQWAVNYANRVAKKHSDCIGSVVVFDSMAHIGRDRITWANQEV